MKKMMLEELFHIVQKLEKFYQLRNPKQVVYEVADVIAIAAKIGIQVEWIDKVLGK